MIFVRFILLIRQAVFCRTAIESQPDEGVSISLRAQPPESCN